ncbi:conserved hypothetical protein [Rubrivivax sp. A210]|nr:conserved hypothetical protein [Rubrivivax sp. A210]
MGIVRDAAAGVLLCQLIYWTRRGVDVLDRDGWVFKTAREWEIETGMSWKVQRRARNTLLGMGVMEERKQLMPARLEFRLKLGALSLMLAERAELEIDGMDLEQFRDSRNPAADELVGRAFLFHGALARVLPLNSAMMCSRLLAGARMPSLEPQMLLQTAARVPGGCTRLVTLHRDEWRGETGLSRDQWQTARRNLREAGVLVERRHNFPRRVDLAVNLRALADVLRQSSKSPVFFEEAEAGRMDGDRDADHSGHPERPYRLDRAKQQGGFGHRPIPPSQSPDPADTDRPILPTVIAQSRLYPLGLQDSLHPPRQEARARGPEPVPSDRPFPPSLGTWGGGGFYAAIKMEYRPVQAPAMVAARSSTPPSPLIWPKLFAETDQAMAQQHLHGLDRSIQQSVLDEIDWMRESGKPIRSPVALARALATRARRGEFAPDGAHRVASARLQSVADEMRRQEEARVRAQQTKAALSPEAEEARKRAMRARDEIVKRRVA